MQVDGWTALHRATTNGHTDTVKALLAAGANVSATTTVRGLVSRVCGGPLWPATRAVYRACSLAVTAGRVTWERCVSKRSPYALVVSSAVECSASLYHYFMMRLFVTDAGGWPDRTAHGSREWSHGYRESSAGSWGQRVCNDDCTWACFTCVWRPAVARDACGVSSL